MELILKETISTLGQEGDVVTVKSGFGRNYLLPQGKAVLATKENLEILEQNKAEIEARRAEERKAAEKLAKKIAGREIIIEQLAGQGRNPDGDRSCRESRSRNHRSIIFGETLRATLQAYTTEPAFTCLPVQSILNTP